MAAAGQAFGLARAVPGIITDLVKKPSVFVAQLVEVIETNGDYDSEFES